MMCFRDVFWTSVSDTHTFSDVSFCVIDATEQFENFHGFLAFSPNMGLLSAAMIYLFSGRHVLLSPS